MSWNFGKGFVEPSSHPVWSPILFPPSGSNYPLGAATNSPWERSKAGALNDLEDDASEVLTKAVIS